MLAGWTGQAAHLLDPVIKRIREEGLRATKISADDTPVEVLAPGCGMTAADTLCAYVAACRYRFTAMDAPGRRSSAA